MTGAGWVQGAALVFESTQRTGDYHGQMHWENFSTWFSELVSHNFAHVCQGGVHQSESGVTILSVDDREPLSASAFCAKGSSGNPPSAMNGIVA
jgi:hypothetical protein